MTDPCLGPLYTLCLQVSPGSVHLLRVVEDFIHLVGDALKAFQSSLIVTDNLGTGGRLGRRGWTWQNPGCCGSGVVSEGSSYFSLSLGPVVPSFNPFFVSLSVSSPPPPLCCFCVYVRPTRVFVPTSISAS